MAGSLSVGGPGGTFYPLYRRATSRCYNPPQVNSEHGGGSVALATAITPNNATDTAVRAIAASLRVALIVGRLTG
jgi:hypothetical protein